MSWLLSSFSPPVLSPDDEEAAEHLSLYPIYTSQYPDHGGPNPYDSSEEHNRADAGHTPLLSWGVPDYDKDGTDDRTARNEPQGQQLYLQAMMDDFQLDDDASSSRSASTTPRALSPPPPILPLRNPN